jgi:hypothetical protein
MERRENAIGGTPTGSLNPLGGGKCRGGANHGQTDYRNELHGGCPPRISRSVARPSLAGFPAANPVAQAIAGRVKAFSRLKFSKTVRFPSKTS